jgi:2-C-methyl-D-erythritol 4-phosphate cytidylyltransferase
VSTAILLDPMREDPLPTTTPPRVAAILLAAGRSTRMGGGVPKAYLELAGEPILVRSARKLKRLPGHVATVLAVHPLDRPRHLEPLLAQLLAQRVSPIVDGGAERAASVLAGLLATPADVDLVVVHDAARPLFPIQPTCTAIAEAAHHGGAILAVPVRDTLKAVDRGGTIQTTVPRTGLWQAQTPQVFQRRVLLEALQKSDLTLPAGTDDAWFVEARGGRVRVVESTWSNLKVTTPEDLRIASRLLAVLPVEDH